MIRWKNKIYHIIFSISNSALIKYLNRLNHHPSSLFSVAFQVNYPSRKLTICEVRISLALTSLLLFLPDLLIQNEVHFYQRTVALCISYPLSCRNFQPRDPLRYHTVSDQTSFLDWWVGLVLKLLFNLYLFILS